MTRSHILPTIVAVLIGLAGVLLLLFAWHLPPFAHSDPFTENAYLRGKVTTIAPQLSGYLHEVDAVDFQEVKKGDLIARIDDRIYREKLAQAEAGLAAAQAALKIAEQNIASTKAVERANQAALASAQSVLATAQTNAERSRALTHQGVTSQQTADQTELALRQAEAAVRQAEAQLDVQHEAILSAQVQLSARQADIANAAAAVELARIDLSNTEIRAPEDGRLGQVSARTGQYVTAGTALVSHVGRDLWVIANFKETELHGMEIGQKVRFRVDALAGRTFTGRVEAFSPATASEFSLLSGSNATGNFTKIAQRLPVRIAIDPDQDRIPQLAPGMSVEVTVSTQG
ncbi:HlyD family secretion protein [Paenirhodobacter populi]|uniref:HlyD family secretion protein n=1 Tax=Paenirhodobacter populi TaxID=2306993 RepID=A0A443JEN5_9RHOB|nr:HlyD family secretion protein [Sinirhodobacter populi]RWR19019.1 HlyD family secretion protein [Sinirhodobacter populi]